MTKIKLNKPRIRLEGFGRYTAVGQDRDNSWYPYKTLIATGTSIADVMNKLRRK